MHTIHLEISSLYFYVTGGLTSFRERAMVAVSKMFSQSIFRREELYAEQTSQELLNIYQTVSAAHPGIERRDLYQKIIMVRTGATLAEAESILKKTEESFAIWPVSHDINFSDVVHYLAVTEFLQIAERPWTLTDMGKAVAEWIPPGL